MKKKICSTMILVLALVLFAGGTSLAQKSGESFINVKLTRPIKNNREIKFESEGGFELYDRSDKKIPVEIIDEKNIKAIISEDGGISLIGIDEGILFTLPGENKYLLSAGGFGDRLISIEGTRYRGYINLQVVGGNIRVLNHIDIEEYLYGLVPREMPSSFPMEALKAQAVAGRTYAIHNTSKHAKEGYNICDTTHCQVYGGYDGEKTTTTEAVDETRGMLALYNGETINAQYHSCSGGHTNNAVDVWGGQSPYLLGVKDDYSANSPHNEWNISIDTDILQSKLQANGINIGELQAIELDEVSTSGNVNNLILRGSQASKELKGSKFRSIVGNTVFKSTKFTILSGKDIAKPAQEIELYVSDGNRTARLDAKKINLIDRNGRRKKIESTSKVMTANSTEDLNIDLKEEINASSNLEGTVVIKGRGFGHGVGMSQYGAKNMAELGHSFKEILKFYYTGIDIL